MASRRCRASRNAVAALLDTSSAVKIGIVARTERTGILTFCRDFRTNNTVKKTAFVVWLCSAVSLLGQTSLVDQGRAALGRDPEKAATLLEKAVAESPNNAEAHYLLGSAYGSMAQHASIFGQPGLAKKTHDEFERAVQRDPNLIDARLGLIEYYMLAPGFMGGDREKAVQQANEIKKRDMFDGHRAFASIYRHEKKPELARKEYVDAVKEMPTSAKARYWLGISYLTADKNYKE